MNMYNLYYITAIYSNNYNIFIRYITLFLMGVNVDDGVVLAIKKKNKNF